MASSMHSARSVVLTALIASLVGFTAFAGDGLGDRWYENNDICSTCNGDGQFCSACYDGLDVPYCGDMTPTAMLPDGRWYFQSNLIAFRRHAAQNEVFQTRNVNTLTSTEVLDNAGASLGPPRVWTLNSSIARDSVLDIDDLTFQHSAGYRLLLGWQLAENYAVEFSYFDLEDWDETGAVADNTLYNDTGVIDPATGLITPVTQPNSLFSPFTGFGDPPNVDFDYNELASIRCQSSLDNVEINVRHLVTKNPSRLAVSVLWGGRHNAVRENFRYSTSAPNLAVPTTNTVNIRTQNDLWGAQIGTQIDFCWDPGWHTEFEVKGGVAHNRAVYEGVYNIQDGAGGGLQNYQDRVDKDITSWIGEMRLTMVYQFNQNLTTHIGYEALILSRIALASSNFEADLGILQNGPWVLNNGGSVVYHGPSAGFTYAW